MAGKGTRKSSGKSAGPHIDYMCGDETTAPSIIDGLEQYLFALASEVSKRWCRQGKADGVLMVLGNFRKGKTARATGMRQLGTNPLECTPLQADSPEFAEMLDIAKDAFGDGAVVVDAGGRVLGSGAYVVVEHPEAKIPDEAGSRHLAAASASLRPDTVATITISEETGRVRLFQDGKVVSYFDPRAT
ncbi:MAG: diadenylate cyclase [Planctomycetes bacterium]|nr:diadenylate cyclase [Planctomycetota bacterium]